jgi:hypothetical protein
MAPTASKKSTKRVIAAVVGLILAVGIVGSFVSHQRLRGSEGKKAATAVVAQPIAVPVQPSVSPAPQPESTTPKPGESGPNDIGNPEFSVKQTLNGPVRSMWESGRYAEALALVNQVLANNPGNTSALQWKKKIRDAQEAEAALK